MVPILHHTVQDKTKGIPPTDTTRRVLLIHNISLSNVKVFSSAHKLDVLSICHPKKYVKAAN